MTDTAAAATIAPSPAEAAATLDTKLADPAWRDAMLKGGQEQRAEMRTLITAKLADNPDAESARLDAMIDGSADGTQLETLYDGQLSTGKMKIIAEDLKNIGVGPGAIKEFMQNQTYTKEIVDAAAEYRAQRISDPEWTKRYAAGGRAERREVALWSIIKINGIVREKVA